MKKLYKYLSIALTSMALLLQVSSASAALIKFDYTDNVIVGDTFTVDVLADMTETSGLFGLGFNISSLQSNVSFISATLNSFIVADAFNDVGGLVDTLDIIIGSDILLARLTFSADSIGNDTVSLFGDTLANSGLLFWDFTEDMNIDTSFNITVVNAAQDVSAPAALSLLLLGVSGLYTRRKRR